MPRLFRQNCNPHNLYPILGREQAIFQHANAFECLARDFNSKGHEL